MGKHSIISLFLCVVATVGYYLLPNTIGDYQLIDLKSLLLYIFWLKYAVGTKNKLFCNRATKFVSGISMEIYLSHMVGYRIIEKIGLVSALGGGLLAYIVSSIGLLVGLMIVIPFIKKFLDWSIALVEQKIEKRKKYYGTNQSNESTH